MSPIHGRLGHAKPYAELEDDEQLCQDRHETRQTVSRRIDEEQGVDRGMTDRRGLDQDEELVQRELGDING